MSIRSGASRAPALACLLLLASLFELTGCHRAAPSDPRLREPVVSIEGPALVRLLERLVLLDGTPAGEHAERLLVRARACDELFGHFSSIPDSPSPDGDFDADADADFNADADAHVDERSARSTGAGLDCGERSARDEDLAAFARDRRAGADGFLSWPVGDDGHLALRIEVDPHGGLRLDGALEAPSQIGALRLFLPADAAPAPAVIGSDTALVHLRIRPQGGLGLAELLPSGGQADRLFALKGRLLEGALLRGTWELAFLPPAPDGDRPLAVAALHHRNAAALEEALDEALTQLEATWPIRRTPRAFLMDTGLTGTGEPLTGGCFLELPILPELAPCWVVTPQAFVIGYRGEAVEQALMPPAVSSPPREDVADPNASDAPATVGGRIDLHLDRVQQLDGRLLEGHAGPMPRLGDLFSKLEIRLAAAGERRTSIHLQLRTGS